MFKREDVYIKYIRGQFGIPKQADQSIKLEVRQFLEDNDISISHSGRICGYTVCLQKVSD